MAREEIQGNSLVFYCKAKKAILKIKSWRFLKSQNNKDKPDHFFLWGAFVHLTALKFLWSGVVSSLWTQGHWWAALFKTHKYWRLYLMPRLNQAQCRPNQVSCLPLWPGCFFYKSSVSTQCLLAAFSHREGLECAELVNCVLHDKCDTRLSLMWKLWKFTQC